MSNAQTEDVDEAPAIAVCGCGAILHDPVSHDCDSEVWTWAHQDQTQPGLYSVLRTAADRSAPTDEPVSREGEGELRFVVYDTPEQGQGLILQSGATGYRIDGPKVYGQQTEIASFDVDERARKAVLDRLATHADARNKARRLRDAVRTMLIHATDQGNYYRVRPDDYERVDEALRLSDRHKVGENDQ